MKNKKETQKPKKAEKKGSSVKQVITATKPRSQVPEGSFICPATGETILKKNCIIDKQKTKIIYFYGIKNETSYSRVYIEKSKDD